MKEVGQRIDQASLISEASRFDEVRTIWLINWSMATESAGKSGSRLEIGGIITSGWGARRRLS